MGAYSYFSNLSNGESNESQIPGTNSNFVSKLSGYKDMIKYALLVRVVNRWDPESVITIAADDYSDVHFVKFYPLSKLAQEDINVMRNYEYDGWETQDGGLACKDTLHEGLWKLKSISYSEWANMNDMSSDQIIRSLGL